MSKVRKTSADLVAFLNGRDDLPTVEQVKNHSFNFYPRHWRNKWDESMPAEPSILTEGESDERGRKSLTRQDLFSLGAAVSTAEEAVNFYVAVCSWGSGTKAREIYRRARALSDPQIGQKLLAGIQKARDPEVSSAAAYESFCSNAQNRILGLGPAFFTKILYFAAEPAKDGHARHLILDQKVAAAIDWPARVWWTPEEYRDYIVLVNETLGQLRDVVERADCIEKALFSS